MKEVCFIHRGLELETNALFRPHIIKAVSPPFLVYWPLIMFPERNVPVMVDSSPLSSHHFFCSVTFQALGTAISERAQENLLLEMPLFQSLIRNILLEAVCDHYIIT